MRSRSRVSDRREGIRRGAAHFRVLPKAVWPDVAQTLQPPWYCDGCRRPLCYSSPNIKIMGRSTIFVSTFVKRTHGENMGSGPLKHGGCRVHVVCFGSGVTNNAPTHGAHRRTATSVVRVRQAGNFRRRRAASRPRARPGERVIPGRSLVPFGPNDRSRYPPRCRFHHTLVAGARIAPRAETVGKRSSE